MFKRLKEKLKNSLSIFSKKVEEETKEEEEKEEQNKPEKEPEEKEFVEEKKVEEPVVDIEEVSKTEEKKEELKQPKKKEILENEKEITTKEDASQEKVSSAQDLLDEVDFIDSKKEQVEKKIKEETPKVEEKKEKEDVKVKSVEEKIDVLEKKAQILEKSESVKKDVVIKAKEITKEVENTKEVEAPKEKKGFFARAKAAFTTKKLSSQKFEDLFWELERALLENNVALDVITKIKDDLKKRLVEQSLPRNLEQVVLDSLRESITDILSVEKKDILKLAQSKKPFVIAFFGINGSGKTTTIAKVAKMLQEQNLTCVMAAGDTFRAAAIHQLEEHAQKLNVKLIKHDYGSDSAAVAFDAVKFAQKNNVDVVLIDTAGRLHSDTNLMDELKKIVRVTSPDLNVFVGESITGNDCIEQAQKFNEHVGVDGIILTKADVDEKGGTALSISYVTKKPILYIGFGQEYDHLKSFDKEFILENLGLS